MKKNQKGNHDKPVKTGKPTVSIATGHREQVGSPAGKSKAANRIDESGEFKGGTETGSTEGRLNKDKSQVEKERIQEGGSDRK